MSMVVKNNIPAVYGLGTLNRNSTALSKSLEKVSTGMKINSAADDNSAWSISERMRVRIRGLDQADQNTQNGRSLLKVAEGAVQSTVDILKTLKEKAINAANDTNTDADRQTIQKELNQSIDQIDDNANVTYNGKILMDGSKNTVGSASYTALTNQSLSVDTQAGTRLTDLHDRSGASLGILSTDKVTVSYVQGGKTYSTTFTVGTNYVQSVIQKAEDIDADTLTFASSANRSMGVALGLDPSDVDAAQHLIDAAEAAVTAARSERDAAQAVVDDINNAIAAADRTSSALTSTFSTFESIASGNLYTTVSGFRWSSLADEEGMDVPNAFSAWKDGQTTPDPATLPWGTDHLALALNLATLSTTNPGTVGTNVLADARDAYAAVYNGTDAQYQYTYNGTTYKGKALVDAKGTFTSALSGAEGTLARKEAAYIAAVNNRNSLAGPQVANTEKIGLSRYGEVVKTTDGKAGLTVIAANSGIGGQISGLSIRITDSEGNVKTAANAALDAFSETIRAENASEDNALTLHVGADPGVAINLGMTDMRSEALGLKGSDGTKLDISTQERANAAISVLDNAIQKALNQQADIGNIASRLEYTSANLRVASDNVQASESTIRDADMAKEMTAYTKNNVLLSASQSMLSQANQNSMNVMTLLQ